MKVIWNIHVIHKTSIPSPAVPSLNAWQINFYLKPGTNLTHTTQDVHLKLQIMHQIKIINVQLTLLKQEG